MFTLLLDKHSTIWRRLLELYFPDGTTIFDFTAGSARLHEGLPARYKLTLCDRHPPHIIRDLMRHWYTDLGRHGAALFDPPHLIKRESLDYEGPSAWRKRGLARHTTNQSLHEFNERVRMLNIKAPCVLKPGGLLFCKIMDPRYKGQLIPHHFTLWQLLTNFTLIDHAVYIRQGATTWSPKRNLQNLHGHWLVFRKMPGLMDIGCW
jgi:hypothetical protein